MKKLLTLFLLLLVGCEQLEIASDKESDAGTDAFQKARRIESSYLEDNMKIDVRGTADAEKYSVQFTWPYLQDGKILRIRLGSVLSEVQPKQTYYTHILSHAQTVTYSFDVLDSSRKLERSFTKSVLIPRDFVVRQENHNITTKTRIEVNRLYLSDKYPLTINENTVDIVATELHAEKGFIQAFPERVTVTEVIDGREVTNELPPTAPIIKKGLSGGNISISAKKLFGKLRIEMRGQNGGEGYKGDPTLGKASTGTPSSEGVLSCVQMPDCARQPWACLIPEEPGIQRISDCSCEKAGKPGGKGAKGAKGSIGKVGMPGGDSGSSRVSIQEYVPLEGFDPTLPQEGGAVVQVNLIPGDGGIGGPGGDGQQGGDGGPGATHPTKKNGCRGPAGPNGDPGDQGDRGPKGPSGKTGLKCIYVGSENINECVQ